MKGRFTRDPGTSKEQVIRDCHGYAFLTTGELRDTLPQERYEQLKNLVAIE